METYKPPKRDLILEVAFKLFLEKGFTNTKIIDIAKEANIGKGTVYEYFKSKDSLFCEIFRKKVVATFSDLPKLLESQLTYTDKLKFAVNFELKNAKAFGNTKNILPYLFSDDSFDNHEEFKAAMHDLMEIKFKILHEIINGGITTGEFKGADPLLSTVALAGAINFYLAFSCDILDKMTRMNFLKDKAWDSEEFYKLIFQGLLAD